MSLEQLQSTFMHGLYQGKLEDAGALIASKSNLDAEQQFAIYQGSVTGTLTEALGDIFPRVKTALGEQFFDALARRYIKIHPSRSPSLDDYGVEFPDFCNTFEPLSDYPYIVDLAQLDWAWHRAFHSADERAVWPEHLQQEFKHQDQSNLEFVLHPSVMLIHSCFPLHQFWLFNDQQKNGELNETFDMQQDPETVLIWRHDYQVCTAAISHAHAVLVEQFRAPTTFEMAFANSLQKSEGDISIRPEHVSESLSFILSNGLLCMASPHLTSTHSKETT